MSTKNNHTRGPAASPPDQNRDFRANLLLDDLEEAVFKRWLKELSKVEVRKVSGSDLLRRLVMPLLRVKAGDFKMKLNPPKPTDDRPTHFPSRE